MKRILIIGSNGFIGQHLYRALSNDYEIFGINKTDSKQLDHEHGFICDISDCTLLHALFDKIMPDIVIHLAAIVHKNDADTSQANYDFINYECACHVFNECIKRKCKLIFSSTIEVYGNRNQTLIDEQSTCSPESYYAIAKYKAEEYLRVHSDELMYAALRFAPVYSKDFTLNIDKRVLLRPFPIAYYCKDGSYTFHFCSITNIVNFIKVLIEKDIFGNTIYNISDKKAVSAKQVISLYKSNGRCKCSIRIPYTLCEGMIGIISIVWKLLRKQDTFLSIRNFKKLFSSTIYSNRKADAICNLNGSIDELFEGNEV